VNGDKRDGRGVSRRQFLRKGSAAAAGVGLALAFPGCTSDSDHSTAVLGKNRRAIDDLRKRLKGKVLVPGDKDFGPATSPANGRYRSILPIAAAQCVDEADVVTCVNWSRENGIAPVARNGGHSYAGYSNNNGLVIDVKTMSGFKVDRATGIAVADAGALNQNAADATLNGPFFLPGGTCLGVGIGGLALGGGIGYQTHWAGLTSDHLLSSRIVTASGEVLQLDANNNPDLFWACRGGAGGSFGINTQMTFKLVESPQNVAFYRFDYRGADAAAAVMKAFHEVLDRAPAALNAVYSAQATPVGAAGPREAIDVFTRGQYVGPVDELRDLVAPLLAAAPPTKQVLQPQTFWDTYRGFASTEGTRHSFGDHSRYSDKPLPDDAVAKVVDLLASCPSRSDAANGSFWSLGWVGGSVVNSVPRTETAYVHRNMLTLLRPTPVWPDDAPDSVSNDLQRWTAEVIAAIAPHTPNESYQNFPNRGITDWQQEYYAENFPRLVEVKRKYDEANLFQNPQSIPPG
jgi:FAD/FMN-containing dehydrogenase